MARPKAALVVTKADRQVLDSMAHRARAAPTRPGALRGGRQSPALS